MSTKKDFDISFEEFRKLPLIVEGESKEIRKWTDDLCLIFFKPTIYSFSQNRTGIVEGSNKLRMECSKYMVEAIKKKGVKHAYIDFGENFVLAKIINNPPNIETVVKAAHTGTSKHRYYAMSKFPIRDNHPYYANKQILPLEPYPETIVRFDWRNPFWKPEDGSKLADEALSDDMADFFIDVKKAKITAQITFHALQEFLAEKNIVIQDLCLFISSDGETVYGEISQDCGRYRHFDLGSLDKDVWRSGGSSQDVLDKWQLLIDLIKS